MSGKKAKPLLSSTACARVRGCMGLTQADMAAGLAVHRRTVNLCEIHGLPVRTALLTREMWLRLAAKTDAQLRVIGEALKLCVREQRRLRRSGKHDTLAPVRVLLGLV